jgi:hypothetical protein
MMSRELVSRSFWRRTLLFATAAGLLLGAWVGRAAGWKIGIAVAAALPCAARFLRIRAGLGSDLYDRTRATR